MAQGLAFRGDRYRRPLASLRHPVVTALAIGRSRDWSSKHKGPTRTGGWLDRNRAQGMGCWRGSDVGEPMQHFDHFGLTGGSAVHGVLGGCRNWIEWHLCVLHPSPSSHLSQRSHSESNPCDGQTQEGLPCMGCCWSLRPPTTVQRAPEGSSRRGQLAPEPLHGDPWGTPRWEAFAIYLDR